MMNKRPYGSRRGKWLREVHPAILIAVSLVVIFILILSINEPLPYQAAPPDDNDPAGTTTLMVLTSTPDPEKVDTQPIPTLDLSPTATQLPEEFINNREQSIGIIVGTVVLVILVLGGTIAGIIARKRE
jgi:TRAP-type mannitol/chloroaromatic compound transport system permease large subunit